MMPTDDRARGDADRDGERSSDDNERSRTNQAPDAVKDPNKKTDGKPGDPGQGDEVDPGGG